MATNQNVNLQDLFTALPVTIVHNRYPQCADWSLMFSAGLENANLPVLSIALLVTIVHNRSCLVLDLSSMFSAGLELVFFSPVFFFVFVLSCRLFLPYTF
jgi:hypothetical protein